MTRERTTFLGLLVLAAACNGKTPAALTSRADAMRQCEILEGDPNQRAFVRCLVDRFGWATDTALAYALREVQRRDSIELATRVEALARLDSIRVGDSLERDSLRLVADSEARVAAEARRRAQVEEDRHAIANAPRLPRAYRLVYIDPPPLDVPSPSGNYIGDVRNKLLFTSDCGEVLRIPLDFRRSFGYEADAKAAGYRVPPITDCQASK